MYDEYLVWWVKECFSMFSVNIVKKPKVLYYFANVTVKISRWWTKSSDDTGCSSGFALLLDLAGAFLQVLSSDLQTISRSGLWDFQSSLLETGTTRGNTPRSWGVRTTECDHRSWCLWQQSLGSVMLCSMPSKRCRIHQRFAVSLYPSIRHFITLQLHWSSNFGFGRYQGIRHFITLQLHWYADFVFTI